MLGLFAFFYVCVHLSMYLTFDQMFSPSGIFADVLKRPYITVGTAGFLITGASGGLAVTASSARSLMPAVDAIGADLVHQYLLAYATAYPALTATRLRVAVSEAGTTATAEATVQRETE